MVFFFNCARALFVTHSFFLSRSLPPSIFLPAFYDRGFFIVSHHDIISQIWCLIFCRWVSESIFLVSDFRISSPQSHRSGFVFSCFPGAVACSCNGECGRGQLCTTSDESLSLENGVCQSVFCSFPLGCKVEFGLGMIGGAASNCSYVLPSPPGRPQATDSWDESGRLSQPCHPTRCWESGCFTIVFLRNSVHGEVNGELYAPKEHRGEQVWRMELFF